MLCNYMVFILTIRLMIVIMGNHKIKSMVSVRILVAVKIVILFVVWMTATVVDFFRFKYSHSYLRSPKMSFSNPRRGTSTVVEIK